MTHSYGAMAWVLEHKQPFEKHQYQYLVGHVTEWQKKNDLQAPNMGEENKNFVENLSYEKGQFSHNPLSGK